MRRPPSPQVRLLAAPHKGPGLPGPLSFWGEKSGPHGSRWALRSGIESAAQLSQPTADPARVARVLWGWAAGADIALPSVGSHFPRSRRPGPGHVTGCPPAFGREPSARGARLAVGTVLPVTDPAGVSSMGWSALPGKRMVLAGRSLHPDRNNLTSIRSDTSPPCGRCSMAYLVGIDDAIVDRRPLTRSSLSAPGCDPGRVTSALGVELEATAHAGGESAVPVTRVGSRADIDHFLVRTNSGTPATSLPDGFSDPARVSPRLVFGLCPMQLPDVPGRERGRQDEPFRWQSAPGAIIPPRDPARATARRPLKSPNSAAGQSAHHGCPASGRTGLAGAAAVKAQNAKVLGEPHEPRRDPGRVTPRRAALTILELDGTGRAVVGVTRPGSYPAHSLAHSSPTGADPARVTGPLAAAVATALAAPVPDAERSTRAGSPPSFQPGLGRTAPPAVACKQPDVAGGPSSLTQRPRIASPAGGGRGFTPGDRDPARVTFGGPHREPQRSGTRIPAQARSAAGHATRVTRYFAAAVQAVPLGHKPMRELPTRPGSCPLLPSTLGSRQRVLARRGSLARDPARVTPSNDGGAVMT